MVGKKVALREFHQVASQRKLHHSVVSRIFRTFSSSQVV